MGKKISVIIPTYRPGAYIFECLDSLANQTFDHNSFETIVILNGERDPFYDEIKSWGNEKEGFTMRFFYSKEANVSNARNIGLEKAEGSFITFIDDDDYVSATYLEELYAISDEETIGLAYPFVFRDGADKKQIRDNMTTEYENFYGKGKLYYLRARRYFGGPWMKMIHKDIIGGTRYNLRFSNGEDSLFMFCVSDRMKYVNFTSRDAVYYRRIRQNSLTTMHKTFNAYLIERLRLALEYTKIYVRHIKNYEFRRYLVAMLGVVNSILKRMIL